MTSPDDYTDEMRELRGLSDRDVGRLLSGEALGDDGLVEVAYHLRSLRAVGARAPGDEVVVRQVAALVAAARALGAAPAGAAPPVRGRGRRIMQRTKVALARVAAAGVALSGATASLAYAGFDLPGGAAETAFRKVLGVELPNQGGAREMEAPSDQGPGATAARVHAVIEAWGDDERGCEFGQAVAAAARGDHSDGPPRDPCMGSEADEDAGGEGRGGKATAKEKASAGPTRAEEARAPGQAKAAEAREKAAERRAARGSRRTSEKAAGSKAKGEEKSASGKAAGEEKSGASNKPAGAGKP